MTTTKIVNGPTKESLFHMFQMGVAELVEFYIGKPYAIPMHVTGIRREDGSGNCWLIDGWVNDRRWGYCLTLYYNTKTQTGHLQDRDVAALETLHAQSWSWDKTEEEAKKERYDQHQANCYCDNWEGCDA
jgi:hypothetical protein